MERISEWRDARLDSCHPGSGIRTNDRIIGSGEGGGDHELRHTSQDDGTNRIHGTFSLLSVIERTQRVRRLTWTLRHGCASVVPVITRSLPKTRWGRSIRIAAWAGMRPTC